MADPKKSPAGTEPAPASSSAVTYRNPRRTSPENSITLQHHRLAREALKRHAPANIPAASHATNLPRRKSSGESNDTGLSDGRKWFDRTNQNFKGSLDTSGMDVDPPFFQRETDSSNEEMVPSQSPAYRFVQNRAPSLRPGYTQSSSAGDYRSVIDDLTIENKRLKEELKKYRQVGPDSLRRDKLFEVKVHGLPNRKKRELEAALRDFTTSLGGSSAGESTGRRKGHGKSRNIHSSSGGLSKHASSSSGSNSRPVDSAYASMSATGTTSATGTSSSAPSRPSLGAKQRSNAKIENYLRDIPEGLYPQTTFMSEKDKKKWVVKRLEHLFTGKMGSQKAPSQGPIMPAPIVEDVEMETKMSISDEKGLAPTKDTSREAKIRPHESQPKGSHSRNTGSASNEHSYSDQLDSRDISGRGSGGHEGANDNGGGSGNSTSPPQELPVAEQRPTRPRDLDPDRQQIPSDNMEYIGHLGLVAPKSQNEYSSRDVSPDANGWVYLNLLCSLAQLHMLNVTPDFIRLAVTEKSTKFQLSSDGRKIRWRGGVEGTKFSSDSSGRDSQKSASQSSDETDGSNDQDQRKKQKTQPSISQKPTNFQPQNQARQDSNSSESFHYKPLFVHRNTSSSDEQPSGEETSSSYGAAEESNFGRNSRWGQSGLSGSSQRKHRRDGAIIYYSGAPFCTDLSGDFGEASPDTAYDMTSSSGPGSLSFGFNRPDMHRSASGSTIPYKPLSGPTSYGATMDLDNPSEPPELTSGETDDDDIEANFEWSDSQQQAPLINLEASGLAGIYPEDHFVVMVTTKRSKRLQLYDRSDDVSSVASSRSKMFLNPSQEMADSNITADSIASRLATMTTSSPRPRSARSGSPSMIKIQYAPGQIRRLPPAPLPPPAFFYDSSNSDLDDDESDDSLLDGFMPRDDVLTSPEADLSGNDEEDEHTDDGGDVAGYGDAIGGGSPPLNKNMGELPPLRGPVGRSSRSSGPLSALSKRTRSSAATAGGAPSGDYSSMEEV